MFVGRKAGVRQHPTMEGHRKHMASQPGHSEATSVQFSLLTVFMIAHLGQEEHQEKEISVVSVTINSAAIPCWASCPGTNLNMIGCIV